VWDLETYDVELMMIYSVADLQRFAAVLGLGPHELVGIEPCNAPTFPAEVAAAICGYCQSCGTTLDEFSPLAGWDIVNAVATPRRLLTDFSIDGIADICCALSIDWHRFGGGLSATA
jgi:hypothetical protein